MKNHHVVTVGLGVVGIALGSLPGTANAGTEKIHWCHATGSATNPWVVVNISVRGGPENPEDMGHNHSHHIYDKEAVWSDALQAWVCEDQSVECEDLMPVLTVDPADDVKRPVSELDLEFVHNTGADVAVEYSSADVDGDGENLGQVTLSNAYDPGQGTVSGQLPEFEGDTGDFADLLMTGWDAADDGGVACQVSDTFDGPQMTCSGANGGEITLGLYDVLVIETTIYDAQETPICGAQTGVVIIVGGCG